MNNIVIAKKSDWKTEDMPKQKSSFVIERSFTSTEMEILRSGNIPQAMEDKWFWYMEGNTLYAHRSWTGYCIYIAPLTKMIMNLCKLDRLDAWGNLRVAFT